MPEPAFDAAAYVDQMAQILNLPIAPEYRAGVIDNMARIQSIAQLVLEVPLPDTIEAATTFQPVPPESHRG